MMNSVTGRRFEITLYRQSPGYSLGSCSLGCLHVHVRPLHGYGIFTIPNSYNSIINVMQNYLWMLYGGDEESWKNHVKVVDCAWDSHSPSGRLPCVEVYDCSTNTDGNPRLLCSTRQNESDLEEAEYIIGELETILGAPSTSALTSRARCDGMNEAVYCLIKSHVVPGVLASLWMDGLCCDSVTIPLYGQGLPWPLRKLLPWDLKRQMIRRYGDRYADVVKEAVKGLESCIHVVDANRKEGTGCTYAIDQEAPMSSDILLISLLSMIRCFPVHASLRDKAKTLDWYLDGIVRHQNVGIMTSVVADTKWSRVRQSSPHVRESTTTEHEDGHHLIQSKAATYWLTGVGTVALGYIVVMVLQSGAAE